MNTAPTYRPSLKFWIITGFAIGFLALAAVSFYAYRNVTRMAWDLQKAAEPDAYIKALTQITGSLSQAESSVRTFIISENTRDLNPYYAERNQVNERLNNLRELAPEDLRIDTIITLVRQKFQYMERIVEVFSNRDASAYELLYNKILQISAGPKDPLGLNLDLTPPNEIPSVAEKNNPPKKDSSGAPAQRSKSGKSLRNPLLDSLQSRTRAAIASLDSAARAAGNSGAGEDYKMLLNQILRTARAIQAESSQQSQERSRVAIYLIAQDGKIMQRITEKLRVVEEEQTQAMNRRAEAARKSAWRTTQIVAWFTALTLIAFLGLLYLIFRDIALKELLQERLAEQKNRAETLARAREEFLANMSHEIRTPMNAIIGFANQLGESKLDKRQEAFVRTISNASQHLLSLLNDVLDFAKLESGHVSLEHIAFSPKAVLEETLQTFTPGAQAKGLSVQMELTAELPEVVMGDPLRLRQMLFNLCSNAIKFTEKGGITLSCQAVSGNEQKTLLIFSVKDTGIGIPPDKQESIFEGFRQADNSITRRFGGTGLGLSITRKLAQLQGGYIRVDSRPGEGSIFTFTIPYTEGKAGDLDQISLPAASAGMALSGKKALVADDEPYNRALMQVILEKWGVQVLMVENGLQMLEALRTQNFDFVLADIQMPEMSGLEACSRARSELGLNLPILGLTATAGPEAAKLCTDAGMQAWLVKPFREADLYQLLLGLLNLSDSPFPALPALHNDTDPGYNLSQLYDMAQGNPDFVRRMLQIFIVNGQNQLSTLREAAEKADAETLSGLAHKLAPSCRHLGMTTLAEGLQALENRLRQQGATPESLEPVQGLIQGLEQAVTAIQKELRALEQLEGV